MAKFNPYASWLRLPHDICPPNFYQLLRLDPSSELTVERVIAAAERANTIVRQHSLGNQVAVAKRLLNEIRMAEATLRDPNRRQEYDRILAAQKSQSRQGKKSPVGFDGPNADITPASLKRRVARRSDREYAAMNEPVIGKDTPKKPVASQPAEFAKPIFASRYVLIIAGVISLVALIGFLVFWQSTSKLPTESVAVANSFENGQKELFNAEDAENATDSTTTFNSSTSEPAQTVADEQTDSARDPNPSLSISSNDSPPPGQVSIAKLEMQRFISDQPGGVFAIALSPDQTSLASGGHSGEISIRETSNWNLVHRVGGRCEKILDLCFSADNKKLIFVGLDPPVADQSKLKTRLGVIDVTNGQVIHDVELSEVRISRLTRADSSQTVFANGGTGGLVQFNFLTGNTSTIPTPFQEQESAMRFGGICSSGDGLVYFSNLSNRRVPASIHQVDTTHNITLPLSELPENASNIKIGRDKSEILVSMQTGVCLFDAITKRPNQIWKFPRKVGGIEDFVYWPERDVYLTADRAGWVFVWHRDHMKPIGAQKVADGPVYSIGTLRDDLLICSSRKREEQISVYKVEFESCPVSEVLAWQPKNPVVSVDPLVNGVRFLSESASQKTPATDDGHSNVEQVSVKTIPDKELFVYETVDMYLTGFDFNSWEFKENDFTGQQHVRNNKFKASMPLYFADRNSDLKVISKRTSSPLEILLLSKISGSILQEMGLVRSREQTLPWERSGRRPHFYSKQLPAKGIAGVSGFAKGFAKFRGQDATHLYLESVPKQKPDLNLLRFETKDLIVTGYSFQVAQLAHNTNASANEALKWSMPRGNFFEGWNYTQFDGKGLQRLKVTAKRDTVAYLMVSSSDESPSGWNGFNAPKAWLEDIKAKTRDPQNYKPQEIYFRKRTLKKGKTLSIPQTSWTGSMLLWSDQFRQPSNEIRTWLRLIGLNRWKLIDELGSPNPRMQMEFGSVRFPFMDGIEFFDLQGQSIFTLRWKYGSDRKSLRTNPLDPSGIYWTVRPATQDTIRITKYDVEDRIIWQAVGERLPKKAGKSQND